MDKYGAFFAFPSRVIDLFEVDCKQRRISLGICEKLCSEQRKDVV